MDPAKGLGEITFRMGKHDQVNMVAHQTISEDFRSRLFNPPLEERQVFLPIRIREEYVLPVIAALSDVKWDIGHDDTRDARHST
jgi:hypothetical protein